MPESGSTNTEKTAGDEKSIIFRPSQNFKHMKKYFKYKFEEAAGQTAPNTCMEPASTQNEAKVDVVKKVIQPPLPPDSPPPVCPPNFVLKKEIENDEYEKSSVEPKSSVEQPNEMSHEDTSSNYDKLVNEVSQEKPKKIMCKDFVRGTCKRGESCVFAHELDLNQLKGVYKFCRDFANGKCKRPLCFFVHATTFEKENFFRTGSLPPHTLNHIKDASRGIFQSVPEAPPVSTIQPVFPTNNTLELRTGGVPPVPSVMTVTPTILEPRVADVFQATQPLSPPKRENEFVGLSYDNDNDPASNKCINCKLLKMRHQKNKVKLESIEKSNQKLKENIIFLDQKKAKLLTMLTMILLSKDLSK